MPQFAARGEVTQEQLIRAELMAGAKLTHQAVEKKYGITRLAAIICRIRRLSRAKVKRGMEALPVISEEVEVRNRLGQPCIVSQYYLDRQAHIQPGMFDGG